MRGLFWRGLAVSLAACTGWLLWTWPPPAEPVEFDLFECNLANGIPRDRIDECKREAGSPVGKPRTLEDVMANGGPTKAMQLVHGSKCIHGTLVKKIDGEWRNIGTCPLQ